MAVVLVEARAWHLAEPIQFPKLARPQRQPGRQLGLSAAAPARRGPDGADPAFLPPLLTRLRVVQTSRSPPALNNTSWPRHSPLLISLPSLASLAPTLLSLNVGQPWTVPFPPPSSSSPSSPGVHQADDGDSGAPCQLGKDRIEEMYGWAYHSKNARPPPEIEPMRRILPALASLTRLTSLFLENENDFSPADVSGIDDGTFRHHVKPEERPELREAVRSRRAEWESSARLVLSLSARTLRRLHLNSRLDLGQPVRIPAAVSMLTALTSLIVECFRIDDVGTGLRNLTALRFLNIDVTRSQFYSYGLRKPFMRAGDLRPLTALEHLCLTEAPAAVAPAIVHALPALTSLMLSEAPGDSFPDDDDDDDNPFAPPLPMPLQVARAAKRSMQSTGLHVWVAGSFAKGTDPRRISVDEIDRLIAERGGEDSDDDDEEEDEEDDGEGGDELGDDEPDDWLENLLHVGDDGEEV